MKYAMPTISSTAPAAIRTTLVPLRPLSLPVVVDGNAVGRTVGLVAVGVVAAGGGRPGDSGLVADPGVSGAAGVVVAWGVVVTWTPECLPVRLAAAACVVAACVVAACVVAAC